MAGIEKNRWKLLEYIVPL